MSRRSLTRTQLLSPRCSSLFTFLISSIVFTECVIGLLAGYQESMVPGRRNVGGVHQPRRIFRDRKYHYSHMLAKQVYLCDVLTMGVESVSKIRGKILEFRKLEMQEELDLKFPVRRTKRFNCKPMEMRWKKLRWFSNPWITSNTTLRKTYQMRKLSLNYRWYEMYLRQVTKLLVFEVVSCENQSIFKN